MRNSYIVACISYISGACPCTHGLSHFVNLFSPGTGAKAIPLSAIVGIAISTVIGVLIYVGNNRMKHKGCLVFFMAALTLFLSVGLFVGGCHEFEEIARTGETRDVWVIENPAVSSDSFPFVLLKPFGWSSSRTVLQITTFWSWLALGCLLHFMKWRRTQWVIRTYGDDSSSDDLTDEIKSAGHDVKNADTVNETIEEGCSNNEEVDPEANPTTATTSNNV